MQRGTFKRSLALILSLSLGPVVFLTPPLALADSSWQVSKISLAQKADQLGTARLDFSISNIDPALLSPPGRMVFAQAILFPITALPFTGHDKVPRRYYECFSPAPRDLLGNTGGTALEPLKRTTTSSIELDYSCFFPSGMLVAHYGLVIRASLTQDRAGLSGPDTEWVFGFGELSPDVLAPGFYTGSRVVTMPTTIGLEVVRTTPQLPIDNLQISPEKITNLALSLSRRAREENSLRTAIESRLTTVLSALGAATEQFGKLKRQNTTVKAGIGLLEAAAIALAADTKTLQAALHSGAFGYPDEEIDRLYRQAIIFDPSSDPEIVSIQVPEVPVDPFSTTPFVKVVVRSKSTPIGFGCCTVYSGNVLTPGFTPLDDGMGGGLVLILNQEIEGQTVVSSLLVRSKYLFDRSRLWEDLGNVVNLGGGRALDAAANNSIDRCYGDSLQCIGWSAVPLEVTKEKVGSTLFDDMLHLYQWLALTNNRLKEIERPEVPYESLLAGTARVEECLISLSSEMKRLESGFRVRKENLCGRKQG